MLQFKCNLLVQRKSESPSGFKLSSNFFNGKDKMMKKSFSEMIKFQLAYEYAFSHSNYLRINQQNFS